MNVQILDHVLVYACMYHVNEINGFLLAEQTQGVCALSSCPPTSGSMRTSVFLNSTTTRDRPYTCRGEEMTFSCEVINGVSLQWAFEPDIPCNRPLGFTIGDDEGETRTRGSYQCHLTSVVQSPLNSYLSSVFKFTPPGSMNNMTVVCGDRLSLCNSAEAERTLSITGKCMLYIFACSSSTEVE